MDDAVLPLTRSDARALQPLRQREQELVDELHRFQTWLTATAEELLALREISERPKCAYCTFGENEMVSLDALQWHIEKECGGHPIAQLVERIKVTEKARDQYQRSYETQSRLLLSCEEARSHLLTALAWALNKLGDPPEFSGSLKEWETAKAALRGEETRG